MLKIEFPKSEFHPKAWGSEEWIVNRPEYCLKILRFNKGAKFSYHFHDLKVETWYLQSGKILLKTKDLNSSKDFEYKLDANFKHIKFDGVIHVPRLVPHQIEALEETVIYEVSTQHFEEDSYRIAPGDSQNE
jgi:mannose-6-phosphate isomerase-like protein (cupin superfamily)